MRSVKSLASPAFFFHQMKQALYICLISPLFSAALKKARLHPPSRTLFLSLSVSLSHSLLHARTHTRTHIHTHFLSPTIYVFPSLPLFLSLVSSDTLVSLRVEEQRDSAMGLLEEMEGRKEEK